MKGVLEIFDPYVRNKVGFYVNINQKILSLKA